jgi:hypothetical protein
LDSYSQDLAKDPVQPFVRDEVPDLVAEAERKNQKRSRPTNKVAEAVLRARQRISSPAEDAHQPDQDYVNRNYIVAEARDNENQNPRQQRDDWRNQRGMYGYRLAPKI